MPTFLEAQTAILDYVNRPSSEMLTQAKREINNTLLWMQRMHKFNFCERVVRVTYPANTLFINIEEACDGRPRDFLNFQLLGSSTGTTGQFIKAKTYDAIMQERFKHQRTNPAGDDFDTTSQDFTSHESSLSTFAPGYVFLSGENVGIYPTPSADKYLLINLHIWLSALSANDDTNFLLENCYDFVLLKTLKRFNIYLKDDQRIMVTKEELDEGWESCKTWDGEVNIVTPNTV